MARLVDWRSVLAVRNLDISTKYFINALGFQLEPIEAGGWSFVRRDGVKLILGECPEVTPASEIGDHSYMLYVYVEEIDELYEELAKRGADVVGPPTDTAWGIREFAVRTPDGHRIRFGQPGAEP